jgi:hypothetical protein
MINKLKSEILNLKQYQNIKFQCFRTQISIPNNYFRVTEPVGICIEQETAVVSHE